MTLPLSLTRFTQPTHPTHTLTPTLPAALPTPVKAPLHEFLLPYALVSPLPNHPSTDTQLGEFWYEVSMTAEPAPLIQLPQLSCELGTLASHTVTLDNPLDKTVQLTCSCSNARNFSVTPDKVRIRVETGCNLSRHRLGSSVISKSVILGGSHAQCSWFIE